MGNFINIVQIVVPYDTDLYDQQQQLILRIKELIPSDMKSRALGGFEADNHEKFE